MDDLIEDDGFEIEDETIEPDMEPAIGAPPQVTVENGERLEQRRFAGGDTLDEPIWMTLKRDIMGCFRLLRKTVWWKASEQVTNREWDLWGPLVFCLTISLLLSMNTSNHQRSKMFTAVFSVIWLGQALITINIKLLGGTISYLHAVSITGYSLFPLFLGSLFSAFVHHRFLRLVAVLFLIAWATMSATKGLGFSGVLHTRLFLAAYPVFLFYVILGWLCVVS